MLVVKMVFISFIYLAMIVSFVFYCISHAPSKKNKPIKRTKMRKWSTMFFVPTIVIVLLYVKMPVQAAIMGLSFAVIDMAFSKIIETL